MKFLQLLFILFSFQLNSIGQKINAGYVDYKIKIEVGRGDANVLTQKVEFIEVSNRMYFMDKVGLYVHQSSDNELAQIAPSKKMLFWKKGKYAYKHEFKDSNCCLLYSNLKTRYSIEHTKLHEVILGYACHKVLIYDDVNKENYLAWYTPQLQGGISPIGYLSVPGMVLKLETPRVSYLATEIIPQELNEKEFDIPKSKLKFSEKAFRSGIIP